MASIFGVSIYTYSLDPPPSSAFYIDTKKSNTPLNGGDDKGALAKI